MTQEELNTLNRNRSTGSRANPEREPFVDLAQEAQEYLEKMEAAYKEETADQPLQGQTTFPGFEEPAEPATEADRITQTAYKTGLSMDFLTSPEDLLSMLNLPEQLSEYMSRNYSQLVQAVASELGADPEQVADKERRTPEQEAKLLELATKAQLARLSAFFDSLYIQAFASLESMAGRVEQRADPEAAAFISYRMKEQAVLYFFAIHPDLKPTKPGTLDEDQKQELQNIFTRLDAFYAEKAEDATDPEEFRPLYSSLFSAFIELENPEEEEAKVIQDVLSNLPLLHGIRPDSFIMPNNKLMNALQQDGIIETTAGARGWDLPVIPATRRRKSIDAFVMVSYDEATGITFKGNNLTEYERQVANACFSLWTEAKKKKVPAVFTIDAVYRAMPGCGEKPSPAQRKAIEETIEKLRRLFTEIDATEELRHRGKLGADQTFHINNYFLNMTKATVKTLNGGQLVDAYIINSEPIVLQYAKMTGQIVTGSARFLAVEKLKLNPRTGKPELSGEPLPMNQDRQAIIGYLTRRVGTMKHDKKNKTPKLSRTIRFDTLFQETGTQTDNRKQAMNNRNFCFDVLDYWKETSYIKGYKAQTSGKSITGVTIDI